MLLRSILKFFRSIDERLFGVKKYYYAADLGGTTGRVGVYDSQSATAALAVVEFLMSQKPHGCEQEDQNSKDERFQKDVIALSDAVNQLAARFGRPYALGIAVAGRIDKERSTLVTAGNLTHWVGQPVVQRIAGWIGCNRIMLGNDAEAPAMAEALHNPSLKGRDFKFMIWGTGIGGSTLRIVNGKPVAFAGEPGHVRKSLKGGLPCNCGQNDCLEANAGGKGVEHRFDVSSAAELDDGMWRQVVHDMTLAVGNMASVELLEDFVFGGGLIHKQTWLLAAIETELSLSGFNIQPRLSLSIFGESAGLVGALALIGLMD